jgi:EAL domain-containing protein (putative c-di-GMP-specific phosphodiesterase class I)
VAFGSEIGGITDALSAADSACFLAKEKGRNRVQMHWADDDELAERRREMDWVGRLREALSDGRILLYAQRIAALRAAPERQHVELLVRLRDVDGSIVPPMAFIPAAERYGVMPAVDRHVIAAAFRHLASMAPDERSRISLSVNLSGRTLSDENLVPFIRGLLDAMPVHRGEICFEVTETAAVHNLAHTTRLLHELRAMGFCFALDDFGSGMSSFSYLKHLPVDFLKIDGAFIRNVRHDRADAAMVEAIARVAKVMDIRTVAEYVEDAETCTLLTGLGVDYAQGFGVHVPEPLETLC